MDRVAARADTVIVGSGVEIDRDNEGTAQPPEPEARTSPATLYGVDPERGADTVIENSRWRESGVVGKLVMPTHRTPVKNLGRSRLALSLVGPLSGSALTSNQGEP